MALQSPCVEALFVLGQRAKRVGAGDVGGAVHVGGTAVHQQKALLFQHSVIFRGGVVVHHGCVAAVGRNGAKAFHKEFIVRTAVLVQNFIHRQLGQGLTGSKAAFQLDLEPHHGHSVPDMGLLCVGKLRFVLHALHHQQRVGAVLHGDGRVLLQHLIHGVVHRGALGQHGLGFRLSSEELQHIVVLRQRDAVGFQLCLCLRGDAGRVDEEYRAAGGHIAVGHGIGSALNVHGAQVQKPCQIIQLAHKLSSAAQLLELAAQLIQLFRRGEARIFLRQDPRWGIRQGRAALRPQLVLKVQGLDGSALLFQCLFQVVHEGRAGGQAAQAQCFALIQGICAVFLHGGHAGFPHALQLDLGTRNFLLGLHKITAVGPQGALGAGDHEVGVLAVEPGEPGQAGVMAGQVFAGVGITHRDQINGHAVCSHGGTQRGKALGYGIHAHMICFLFSHRKARQRCISVWPYCIIPGKRLQCRGRTVWNDLRLRSGHVQRKIFLYLWFTRGVCSFRRKRQVCGHARGSLPEGAGKTVRF